MDNEILFLISMFMVIMALSRIVSGLMLGHWLTSDYWELTKDDKIGKTLDIMILLFLIVGSIGMWIYR
jgi:hypothetical protein